MAAIATSLIIAIALPGGIAVRVGVCVTGVVLAAAALVDVHERRLPNRLLLAGGVAPFVVAGVAADLSVLGSVCAGALVAGAAMLVVRLARGVGMGDVKAAAVVGASTGSVAAVAAPVAIAVAATVAAAYGAAAHRHRLPLGPSLWIGWAAALLAHSSGWWS